MNDNPVNHYYVWKDNPRFWGAPGLWMVARVPEDRWKMGSRYTTPRYTFPSWKSAMVWVNKSLKLDAKYAEER